MITAHNPGGRTLTDAENTAAHTRLLEALAALRVEWYPAVGGDPDRRHVEESVAVVGLDDDAARALGRRFGQDAIFAWWPAGW